MLIGLYSRGSVDRFLSVAGALFFGLAALTAARLAIADTIFRQDTTEAVQRAIAFQGSARSAEFEQRLAELDPARARERLERAVGANPRSSSAWIALGLLQEATGEYSFAERSLLQAAEVDHQYLPPWTLSNFYFRQANRERFWPWADRAASLAYGDLGPLLRLCDRFEPDPANVLMHFRDLRRLRPPYLNFLIGENRLDAAQRVGRGMVGDHANDSHLVDLADRQLRAGNTASAIEMWNASSGFPSIDPSAGTILTNGDLARAPLNLGFDWRVGQTDGIAQSWRPSELAFTFSGSQPEAGVLLKQTICLAPRHFRLRFDYMTSTAITGRSGPTGLRWSLDDIEGPKIELSSAWKEGRFDVPRQRGIREIKLSYRRESGTTRAEGRIEIRNLRLEGIS